jgi:hypothetical protein
MRAAPREIAPAQACRIAPSRCRAPRAFACRGLVRVMHHVESLSRASRATVRSALALVLDAYAAKNIFENFFKNS